MKPKRIARRPATEPALYARTTELPPELLQNAGRRLAIACWAWMGLWTTALVMNDFVAPRLSPGQKLDDAWPFPGTPAAIFVIVTSLALLAYARHSRSDPRRLLDLGLGYEIAIAAAIGIVNQWTPNVWAPSWISVLVVVHPLIAPNTPLKTFFASIAAASMDLAALVVPAARGVELPSGAEILWANLGTYLCALLAVLASRTIIGLGRQVSAERELGSYQLGELLGEGGMAVVYRATHRMLARPAAIKLVRADVLGTGDPQRALRVLQRFEREAQATALLSCPHTIDLYDFGIAEDGTFYYVMELLEGFDLDTFVTRFGPASPERSVHFLRQVCQSLSEAHERGLIHRDVKPANIYVCRYGREVDFIKVLDFGLVKSEHELGDVKVSMTLGNVPGGTPAFMAPEQILGKEPVDHRVDLYSLGCLGYWLLTGELVFTGSTSLEIMMHHVDTIPPPPSARTEIAVPAALDRVIMQCLEKDPGRRPQTAEALDLLLAECETDARWTADRAHAWWNQFHPAGSVSA